MLITFYIYRWCGSISCIWVYVVSLAGKYVDCSQSVRTGCN